MTMVLNSDAGTAPPSGALQSAAVVMNVAITGLRDDHTDDEDTDELMDEDTDDESTDDYTEGTYNVP